MSFHSVLFVCLGNICRSPMAEAAFNDEVRKRNLPVTVDSAGIGSWHINQPPDPRTITEVAKHHIDIRNYLGRQINQQDFQNFTHIIGMDQNNIRALKKIAPANSHQKIKLLMDYVPNHLGEEIADPYYGEQNAFSQTWEQVKLGCFHLANYFELKNDE